MAFAAWVHYRYKEPSCTEIECYWKKSTLCDVDMCLPTKMMGGRRTKPRFTSAYKSDGSFFTEAMAQISLLRKPSMMIQSQFTSKSHELCVYGMAYEFARLQGIQKEYEDFVDFAQSAFMRANLQAVKNETTAQSSSPLWKTLRFCRTTASILNEASCASEADVPRESLLKKYFGAQKFVPTKAMIRGLQVEDAVRTAFAKSKKCRIGPGYLQLSRDFPLMAATPDGVSRDFTLEIKSPERNTNVKSYLRQDGIPTKKVLLQMLLQMKFCEKDYGYLVITDEDFEKNGKFIEVKVNFSDHEKLLQDCMKKAELFWKNVVYLKLMQIMRPVLL